ncbi:NAD(P)/FAD-dependent oxidoreductase [Candidatus Woesearchaeota archaeon]|nr:NAD(P)/FAD-dependent oxidoreductase [Candidatus Woesearchaeota archaeon]
MTKKQIVVVGAGVAGLVCANLIAKERPDYKVILLESQEHVGGLAQAWNLSPTLRDGRKVRVDYELTHAISEMGEGGTFHQLYTDLGVDWERIGCFEAAPQFAQFITPGKEPLILYNTLEENVTAFLEKYPAERRGVTRFVRFMENLDGQRELPPGLKRTLEEKVAPRIAEFPQPWRILSQVALFSYTKPTFVGHRNDTFEHILDRYFDNKELKTTLSMLYGYVGLPPSTCSGNLFSLMLLSYWRGGGPQAPAEHSFQAMHDELARVLEEKYGGELKLRTKATDVIIEEGKIKGIEFELQRGSKPKFMLDADCVIFAGDIMNSFLRLTERHLPKKYREKISSYSMSMSLMATHVVTDLPLHEMKKQLGYAANILASSPEAIEKETETNFPERFVFYVNVPTVLRPDAGLITDLEGRAINDLHLVDIVMRARNPQESRGMRESDKRGKYASFKDDHMSKMIQITDQLLIPGLAQHVLHQSMYTGATYGRYGNSCEGAVYSIAPTVEGFVPNRPSPIVPLEGAFLTGAAILAGGVGGATSGAIETARAVLRYLKKKE